MLSNTQAEVSLSQNSWPILVEYQVSAQILKKKATVFKNKSFEIKIPLDNDS